MHISTSENTNISTVDAPEDDRSDAATSKGILLRLGNAREARELAAFAVCKLHASNAPQQFMRIKRIPRATKTSNISESNSRTSPRFADREDVAVIDL